jgi:predicted component of type VI protein secretion system
MAQFRFVMRSGPVVGKVFPLEAQEISIGRETTNMIVINDVQISRRHARMELRGPTYVIQDLGSTNGTFVNGIRISGMQVLTPGDAVTFGEGIVLTYESTTDLNATLLSSMPPQTVVQRPAPAPTPAPTPAAPPTFRPPPAPVYSGKVPSGPMPPAASPAPAPRSTPAPVYSGKVPAGPVARPPAATPVKKGGGRTVIIVVVAVVLILCLCVAIPFIADALKLDCVVPFKWFFNIAGPLFGYGLCP